MHLFYTPDIAANADKYQLSEQESRHCVRVLRLQIGDDIVLMDGKGKWYHSKISTTGKNHVEVRIEHISIPYPEKAHHIHLAVAPTKNIDRYEWLLEKATEIGIDTITPIICEHSERKEVKIERLEKIVTSAVKQSLKSYHPTVEEGLSFKKFLEQEFSEYDFLGMAHCETSAQKTTIPQSAVKNRRYLVLIGPEGDFSPNEIVVAQEKGFVELSLGNARLRTETAALFACFQLNQLQW